jgi:hypothetical protein
MPYHELQANFKNAVFWDVMPCDSCKNRCFGGKFRLQHLGENSQ